MLLVRGLRDASVEGFLRSIQDEKKGQGLRDRANLV